MWNLRFVSALLGSLVVPIVYEVSVPQAQKLFVVYLAVLKKIKNKIINNAGYDMAVWRCEIPHVEKYFST